MSEITGVQCTLIFHVKINAIADELGMSVEDVIDTWEEGRLGDELERLSIADVLAISEEGEANSIEVGSGYTR